MLDHIDLNQVLILDIETVPQYQSFDDVPANYQTLWEAKSAYQRKEGVSPEEFYPRAGIWAEFGKVICISVGIFAAQHKPLQLRVKSFYGDEEIDILESFSALLRKQPESLVLCAHNGKEFDFPYLCRRMLINGLTIPKQLHIHGKKPWEINHLDTMDLWKFGDYKHYTSLNLLAYVFDIPTPKDDIDGSDVHHVYWKEKDLERIKVYCEKDIVTTAQLILRFKSLPLLTEDLITIVKG